MTWQEGKSEGLREILSYDKRNRNAISTLWTSIVGVENLYISLKISTKNTFQRESFSINFQYVVIVGSYLRVNSIIYKENFEIKVP